jgi:AAA domain
MEDGVDELRRRIKAVLIHHGIALSELKGWLFLAAPGVAAGKLMTLDQHGRPAPGGLAAKLDHVITTRRIDIVSLDPFVKTHSVEENSNSAIDDVVQILSNLSITHDMAVDTPHHMSKGAPDPGNANRGRGASSAKDAGRLVYTLTPMSPEEAQALGISELDRRSLIRMDSGKVNIAPPTLDAKWFRIVGVEIGNPTEIYPNGDQVQTVEPWTPPDTFEGLSTMLLNQILSDIDAGTPDGNRYTDAPKAFERAAWRLIVNHCPDKSEAAARKIIKTWTLSGLLIRKSYENPATRKRVNGFWIDPEKRPS